MNVYLFEKNLSPLLLQKNMRELELIVQECILTAIRESIPTEDIIKAYMDESVEQEEEVVIENIEQPVLSEGMEGTEETKGAEGERGEVKSESAKNEVPETVPSIKNLDDSPVITRLTFNDYDSVMDDNNNVENISAPKTIERLEEISTERAIQRKLEEEEDLDEKITIHTDSLDLEPLDLDFLDIDNSKSDFVELDDIQELV
jgi:hypothetical protein